MDSVILALGCNKLTSKVEEIAVGTVPWSGIKIFDISMLNPNLINFDNAYIGFDGTLINRGNAIQHYTKYDINSGDILERSYHILAKTKIKDRRLYMITDGLTDPQWTTISKIIKDMEINNIQLADAKLVYNDDNIDIQGIKRDILEIDLMNTNSSGYANIIMD